MFVSFLFHLEVNTSFADSKYRDRMATSVKISRIDDTHCNPKWEWTAMGSPDVLTPAQCDFIRKSTRLEEEQAEYKYDGESTVVRLDVCTNDVVLVTMEAF